jgi:ankyrin repeat protein
MKLNRTCGLLAWIFLAVGLAARPDPGKYFSDPKAISLSEAAAVGDTSTLERLSKTGADVNAPGRGGFTPLLYAFLSQSKEGFSYLLSRGANPNIQLTESFDDLLIKGSSTTSFAAMDKDIWYLKQVLEHGGDPNLVNATRSHTPIFSAIFSMRTENAEYLIKHGANLNWQDRDGKTPLIQSAILNQFELAYSMLEAGADPMIKDRFGNTVVHSIKRSIGHTLPDGSKWREKLVALLKSKGIEVTEGP